MNSKLKKKKTNNYLSKSTKNEHKHNRKYEKENIMNKFLFENPELLKNLRKANSKTPNLVFL